MGGEVCGSKQSEVWGQLEQLQKAHEALHQTICQLDERLKRVLREKINVPEPESKLKQQSLVILANDIRQEVIRTSSMIECLVDLMQRLEV